MKRIPVDFTLAVIFLILAGYCNASTLSDVRRELTRGMVATAEKSARATLVDHPSDAAAHYAYALVLDTQRKHDLALAEILEARRLDPSSEFASHSEVDGLIDKLSAKVSAVAINMPVSTSPIDSISPSNAALAPFSALPIDEQPIRSDDGQSDFTHKYTALCVLLLCGGGFAMIRTRKQSRAPRISMQPGPTDVKPLLDQANAMLESPNSPEEYATVSRIQKSLSTLYARVQVYPGHLLGKSELALLQNAAEALQSARKIEEKSLAFRLYAAFARLRSQLNNLAIPFKPTRTGTTEERREPDFGAPD